MTKTDDHMSERNQILALLSEKLRPTQIARERDLPTHKVVEHLKGAVHNGLIQRSDILFTMDKELRSQLDIYNEISTSTSMQAKALRLDGQDVDAEEIELYLAYRDKRIRGGDLYELLSELERTVHAKIKFLLLKKYGDGEQGWWRQGVPENVRVACVEARERDADFDDDPYNYTTLIHLSVILDKNWSLFEGQLPADVRKHKRKLIQDFKQLNGIRNRIMHPVRGEPPTEQDFEFVKKMHKTLRFAYAG